MQALLGQLPPENNFFYLYMFDKKIAPKKTGVTP